MAEKHRPADPETVSVSKPVLILLHGFLGSQADWSALIAALPDIECIAIDLPGHGALKQAAIPSLAQFPNWLATELQHRGISRYHLLGYSLGGRLAMAFAATNPAGLQSLIIENAHPGLITDETKQQRARNDAGWARRFYREPLPDVLADWYQQPVFANLTANERQSLIAARSLNSFSSLATVLCRYSLARQPDYRGWIKTTTTPVLYLCGTKDSKFQTVGYSLQATAPDLQLTLLPGGHNLHRATPDGMAQVIRHWLNTYSGH